MEIRDVLRKRGLRDFLIRLFVLAAAFVGFSAVLGPLIVNTALLKKLHFEIYGGLGYIVLLMCVAFVILARERLAGIRRYKWCVENIIFGAMSIVLAFCFYWLGSFIQVNIGFVLGNYLRYMVIAHGLFLLTFVFLGLGVFGLRFVLEFVRDFKKELLICLGLSGVFYASMTLVWRSWEVLSFLVSRVVYFMLRLTFPHVQLILPRTIVAEGFSASIEEACSGVYSIFLFTCLYVFMVLVDWKKMNKVKAALMTFPTIIGLFFVNCLRIYFLFVVGVLYDPRFAINMFHSYIGTVLFLIYFMVFMGLFYRWLKR